MFNKQLNNLSPLIKPPGEETPVSSGSLAAFSLGEKKCTRCKIPKSLDKFPKRKQRRDGRGSMCNTCMVLLITRCRNANSEKYNNSSRRWREANPEKNKESLRQADRKRRNTLQGKLNDNVSSLIYQSLRKNKGNRHWEDLVEFTLDQLKQHIEKNFTKNMCWEQYMKGEIHLDHKIPKSVFNFETAEDLDFKKCWSLKNLQPLWKYDNLRKHSKLDKPFQPSLLIKEFHVGTG